MTYWTSLEAEDKIDAISVSEGNVLGGGSGLTRFIAHRPGVLAQLFGLGKTTYTVEIVVNPEASAGFVDINGNRFAPSIDRLIAHELSEAFVTQQGGYFSTRDPTQVVHLENAIATQLEPTAPYRHPTIGHSDGPGLGL